MLSEYRRREHGEGVGGDLPNRSVAIVDSQEASKRADIVVVFDAGVASFFYRTPGCAGQGP